MGWCRKMLIRDWIMESPIEQGRRRVTDGRWEDTKLRKMQQQARAVGKRELIRG